MKKYLFFLITLITSIGVWAQKKNAPVATQVEVLAPAEFQKKMQTEIGILIDVRTPSEYKKGHLKGARLINLFEDDFEVQLNKLDKSKTYYVYCAVGGRSEETVEKMKTLGFKKVVDLKGGFTGWSKAGLPVSLD